MEFNIIKREPMWLQDGKSYFYTYQIDNKPERYKIKMFYHKHQWFFEDWSLKQSPFYNSKEDRTKFINEIYKWAKGGSYRKTHPIAFTRYEILKNEKEQLLNKISEIDKMLSKEEALENKRLYDEYNSDINIETLNDFEQKLNSLIGKDYCIRKLYYKDMEYLTIYDLKKDKYRSIMSLYDNEIEFNELPTYLMKLLK